MIDRLQEIREHYLPQSEHKGRHPAEDIIYLLHRLEAVENLLDMALECAGYEVLVNGTREPIQSDEPMHSLWQAWQQVKTATEKEAK